MSIPKVTIQIVTWNSLNFLPECLISVINQTYRDFQILVIDNNSSDGTVDFVRKNYPDIGLFQNKKNLGFSRANNQGIKLLSSPYVVICNPDIVMEPTWLEKIMAKVENGAYKNFGSFSGKLLKSKITNGEVEKSEVIDSCGLAIYKNHKFAEVGAGEPKEKFTEDMEVFGQSGALVLYNREALNNVYIKTGEQNQGEYFDEDFFCYKEDVDLAWRLQLLGWKSLFVADAIAYHVRSMSAAQQKGFINLIKNRKTQSKVTRSYSYRNHFLVLFKNESLKNFFKYFFYISFFELGKFFYVLIFEPSSLKAVWEALKLRKKMRKKYKTFSGRIKVNENYIRKWFL